MLCVLGVLGGKKYVLAARVFYAKQSQFPKSSN